MTHVGIMMAGDAALLAGVLYVSLALRSLTLPEVITYTEHLYAFAPLFVVYEIILYIAGFWERRFVPTARKTFDRLLPAHVLATVVMALYFYLLPFFAIAPKTNLLIFATFLFGAMFIWKCFGTRLFTMYPVRVVSLGQNKEIRELLAGQPLWNIEVTAALTNLVGFERIISTLELERADTVLVNMQRYPRIDVLYKLIFENITVLDTASIREEMTEQVDLDQVDELWFISNVRNQQNLWQSLAKRFFDLCLAVPLLVAYVLVLPFVALAIKVEDGGPVFITMPRVGFKGKVFNLLKFRSMTADKPGSRQKLYDHNKQVTRVGKILRKTSIDEFPQVWSIIRGQQSFVGPRPEIPKMVKTYTKEIPHYNMRHLVRPGLSGWAQIKQENAPHHTSEGAVDATREKLAFDLYYIKHNSVFLYIKIVLQTVGNVLNRKNH